LAAAEKAAAEKAAAVKAAEAGAAAAAAATAAAVAAGAAAERAEAQRRALEEEARTKIIRPGLACSGHGFRELGRCRCASLYMGQHCETVRVFPGLELDGYGGFIAFNQEHLEDMADVVIHGPVGALDDAPDVAGGSGDSDRSSHTSSSDRESQVMEVVRDISPVVKQQLAAVLPSGDVLVERFYNTCAVVGSTPRPWVRGQPLDPGSGVNPPTLGQGSTPRPWVRAWGVRIRVWG
jgi:hypothetical protein